MSARNLLLEIVSNIFLWSIPGLLLFSGCTTQQIGDVPPDFYFMMDVQSAEPNSTQNINIKLDASGQGHYEYYDTGGVIQYDTNDIVTYDPGQVERVGDFELSDAELTQLWDAINENNFFELSENYQMEIGSSYAFLLVEADGNQHIVNNIGMEVPELQALIETVQAMVPIDVELDYGKGYVPQK